MQLESDMKFKAHHEWREGKRKQSRRQRSRNEDIGEKTNGAVVEDVM